MRTAHFDSAVEKTERALTLCAMLVLHKFITQAQTCAYLPDQMAKMEYSLAPIMEPAEYESLMNRGCRKFGNTFFRPVCANCTMCRPIRFPLDEFQPDRKQRRALKRNSELEVRFGVPICDAKRLDLFRRYHLAQEKIKRWPYQHETAEEYQFSFVRNPIPASEVSIWSGSRLFGILITENTPNVISAVYHYYDPEFRDRSLGTFLILKGAEMARRTGRRWMYLGFHIKGCASMEYKTCFRPCEIMRPDGTWERLP